MIIANRSTTTKASPERIWDFWSDVESWHTWDNGLDSAAIEGEFVAGTTGWLKPVNAPKVKLELMKVQTNKFFHDRTQLPLGWVDFFHTLEQIGDQTKITQQIEMTGPLTFIFSRLIGKGLKQRLPSVMNTLVRLAEKEQIGTL